jgi:catechol 2,3-dioxygenase-like lactoylglutathione lyase family enzyme
MRRRSRSKVDILFAYISRRLGMMLLIVFGASYMAYNLEAYSADPLSQFGESTELNKETLIARMIRELHLDVPPPIRYFSWLRGIVGSLWGNFDMGLTRTKLPVIEALGQAIPVTIKLVITSTILAIILGISIGMITAIRHTGLVVANLDRALHFWCEVLGFKILKQMDEAGPHIDAMMGLDGVDVVTAKLAAPDGNVLELLHFRSHFSSCFRCVLGSPGDALDILASMAAVFSAADFADISPCLVFDSTCPGGM